MITAPAEFELLSEKRLLLQRGKLSARVPEPAAGFTVETPSATLVDLGHRIRGRRRSGRQWRGSRLPRRGHRQAAVADAIRGPSGLSKTRRRGSMPPPPRPSGIEVDSTRFLRQLDEPRTSYSQLVVAQAPLSLSPHGADDRRQLADRLWFARRVRPARALSRATVSPWCPGCFGSVTATAGAELR